ncbi:hypothetical protein ACFB49_34740 [Sphingomonas sp. DBB INV C78]|uniref:OmpA family protein n=1 Tax=Sphingomonas sp. DBB INV C78 TaxID=3349434 RepID=UPI0036D36ACD
MRTARTPRWAVSFADLCLLLLGFFILIQAQGGRPERLAAGLRAAFGENEGEQRRDNAFRAAGLFQSGEAVLTPAAAATLRKIGARARAENAAVIVISEGSDAGAHRFDRWELAAARTAAIGRAIREGGVDEARIDISIPSVSGANAGKGQEITVRLVAAR